MNKFLKIISVTFMLMLLTIPAKAQGNYYNMIDETGSIVYVTGWKVRVGDEFLTENNKRYEIIKIDGQNATVKFVSNVNLVEYLNHYKTKEYLLSFFQIPIAEAENTKKVALYHTHNDEAYIPSDGKDSSDEGNGGIIKVGDAFMQALEKNGIEAIHSDASHSPHDDMAYERSRRTVVDLLKQQPDAIFDIHRDAGPPEAYSGVVEGQDITKVQLVVGKFGPTGKQIEEYALQMKAVSDERYPGLVKGIFFAKGGDYNQDLHPKSMLVEVGDQNNKREEAERGIAMFADIIPTVLGVTSANPSNVEGSAGVATKSAGASGSVKSIGYIVAFLVGGVIIFMFISTGGVKEATAKVHNFTTNEFKDVFQDSNGKKDDKKDDNLEKNPNK